MSFQSPPPIQNPTSIKKRPKWHFVLGGCLLLLVCPCVISPLYMESLSPEKRAQIEADTERTRVKLEADRVERERKERIEREEADRKARRTKLLKDAWYISHDFVRQKLIAPSTAKFPNWYDTEENPTLSVNLEQDGTYFVMSDYEAKNGFGVPIAGRYSCRLKLISGDGSEQSKSRWKLLDLRINTRAD